MSWQPEPETLADIQSREIKDFGPVYICGCEKRGERWHCCQYHDGFEAGLEAAARSQRENVEEP